MRNRHSPAFLHPCLGPALSSAGDRMVSRAMLLSASFKAWLGQGLTQLSAALCTRAEVWPMPSQLLHPSSRLGCTRAGRVMAPLPSRTATHLGWRWAVCVPPYPTNCSCGLFDFTPGLPYPSQLLFAPFCLQGENPQPKREYRDVSHLLLQVVSSPRSLPAASSGTEGACLQGRLPKPSTVS